MNVTKFINSKSIAKYLEDIKYKFSALEAAYLVWQSKFTTLNEKLSAWEEIFSSMPDESVSKRRWGWRTDEPSLHAFLKRYIEFNKRQIEEFYKEGKNYVYSFAQLSDSDERCYEDGRIFNSLSKCKSAIKEYREKSIKFYEIKKYTLNDDSYSKATVDKKGEIFDLYSVVTGDWSKEELELTQRFDGLWIKLPTPFKRGDLVYQGNRRVYMGVKEKEPFVLQHICTWDENELRENNYTDEKDIEEYKRLLNHHIESGDVTDMLCRGHFVENGRMYSDHTTIGTYLDLDYYEGELPEGEKFLTALSNYEKGEISIAALAGAYKIHNDILREKYVKKYAYFTDEELELSGLKRN